VLREIRVPDIADFVNVPIIEVHVGPGQAIDMDSPIVTLESDKATMDIPAPGAGIISFVCVNGDKVNYGTIVLTMRIAKAMKKAE
jgi:pyruvate/2-oxoglutarate dehydrogenase complex dihydrolipoamide acyltransferase (E2) component